MSKNTLPKDAIAGGNPVSALHLAALRLETAPSDPQRHLDLLAAMAFVDPGQVPKGPAEKLFSCFAAGANFPASFACLLYMSRGEELPPEKLLEQFLTIFGPGGSKGPANKPPSRDESPEAVAALPDLTDAEVMKMARSAWDKAITSLFLPPPAQGRSVVLFQAMGSDSLKLLLKKGNLRFIPSGDKVISQGETDSSFYLLVHGVLDVLRESETGKTRLGFLRAGSFFGEMSLVTSGPRNATIVASETAVIVEISWDLLSSMLEHDPELADELARYTRFRLLKNLMATSALFKTLSSEAKADIIAAFEPVVPDEGATIIKEGSTSPGLFLIASGEVHVVSGKGKEKTLLSILSPGSVFGEISLIRETPANASIVIKEEGVVLMQLTKERFDRLAVFYPDLLSHVYQVAIDRSETTRKVKADVAIPAEDLVF
ncbi:cyclic nucleotide-binding domain-containing protein [Myxococcota bacterium]|nr:cyclic nucleotide-binding domain-containing protein [Myxococcota bacterium]MBU1537524.1 cyclic nucleotide-binding domain-containing protein [Myxococcota bacterium]